MKHIPMPARQLPTGDLATPHELFMAEEQPTEANARAVEQLQGMPEYRKYIQALRKAELEAKRRSLEQDGQS